VPPLPSGSGATTTIKLEIYKNGTMNKTAI